MKIKLFNKAKNLGFTMIELLIVISILGILAVAVLSAINPVEQINRGRDTGTRSDAEQLLSAIDRFNAFNGYMPWQTGAGDTETDVTWGSVAAVYPLATGGCTTLEALSSEPAAEATCTSWAEELKVSFVDRIIAPNYRGLYIYRGTGSSDAVYVCFAPQSNAFAQEVLEKFDDNDDGTIVAAEVPDDYPASAYGNPTAGGVLNCGEQGNCVCLP